MIKLASILVVLVLAVLAAAGYPVFAQGPPEQEGKQASIVDPLIQQFIDQQGSATPQPTPQPDSSAVTRGLFPDSGVTAKGVPWTEESGAWGPTGGDAEGVPESEAADSDDPPVRFDSSGNVQVYIHLENTEEATLQQLRELGATIEVTNSDWNIAQSWVAPSALEPLAALAVVKEITPPDYGQTKAGRVNSEGDGIHRADLVRAFSGISGRGVKVGVISDGVTRRSTAVASGDLPSSLEIHPGSSGSGDEGTALLEIIHDLAPNAELAFSGPETNLEMVDSILWLANDAFDGEGVDVMVDDLGYYSEPFYEDGPVALAAADAVAGGVVFASSAGNYAQAHYTGTFSDDGNGYHDFDSSSETDIALRIRIGASVVLQWNDQFGSSGNDYDLFVCPPGLKPIKFNLQNGVCTGSNREQDGDDNPYERVSTFFLFYSTADVYIRKYSGDTRELKLFVPRGSVREHGTSEGSIIGHEAVEGLLSIGAIDASDPGNDEAQSYSDRGPVEIYFPTRETRNKPDLMGIDGVLVTGAGGFGRPEEGVTGNRFFGTSAAAPHVAGIAALVMEAQRKADPTMTKKEVADAVTQKLKDTAIDLGEDGFDTTFGYGRADAWSAIESLADSSDSLDLYSLTTYEDTHTVNSTGDGADADTTDGVCDDGTVDGATNCTLRAAIQQTNAGTSSAIKFNISGGGVQTISPASALPVITKPVFIDGYSQPGASAGTVLIELDGTSAGSSVDGLELKADRNIVRGLAVNGFSQHGIVIQKRTGVAQLASSRHVLMGNLIGTDTTGSTDEGNGWSGVYLHVAHYVLLKGNVISGNGRRGVQTSIGSAIHLYDNKIGTNAAGTSDLGNTLGGIYVSSRSVVLKGNVISGNESHGIHLASTTSDALIENNRIGTNDAGSAALANTGSGIYIFGPNDNSVFGNTIGSNGSHGVRIHGTYTEGNVISGNYIGTNAGGTDLGNSGSGLYLSGGTNDNTVEENTIAYNTGDGVSITGSGSLGNTVRENSIHSNDGIGIDLGDDGVTANDATDSDSGPNHLQNYPHNITYATRGDEASANFNLYMTANRRYVVDFYSCDSSASGEGKDWLGYTYDTLSTSELVTFNASTLISGHWVGFSPTTATHITATATDTEAGTTSEFAPCVARVDLPELVISETEVKVAEGGTATYTVRLTALPSEDVTVTLTSGNTSEATVSDETLTFTTTNGTTAQTVTVTGVDDSDSLNEATTILHQVSIGDNDYITALLPVAVTDDDALALTLASTDTRATFPDDVSVGHYYDGRIGSDEDNSFNEGTTATYTVELDSEPDGDITISLSSSDTGALTVSPASITFTKTGDASDPSKYEWDDPQTVTITAVSDTDGWDEIEAVFHETTINDETYTLGQVRAIIKDSALPTLSYRQNNADIEELSVNEGETTTYTVEMDSEPDADVTVLMLSTDTGAVTISHDSIVFTKTGEAAADGKYEWDDPQTITVTGVADGDEFDDVEYIWHWHNIDGRPFYWWPSVKVTVADGNRAPYFEDGLETTREIREDAIQGDNVGDPITATDLNAGDTLTYTLDDPSGLFAINGATGQITVAITDPPVAQPFDYETGDRDYSMEVSVTETGVNGLSDKIEVKVLVVNVNEKPTVTGDTVLTFPENTATTRVLDRYTATDPENDTISWSVEGTDTDAFTIDSSGNLRFSGEQDFETKDELSITIVGTDDGEPPLKDELPVTVTLTDVDEPPEITGSESLTFPEGTSDTTVLATYGAHDPEEVTSTFTWSLSGSDSGDFDLSASGELSFKEAPNFESPADSGRNNEYNVNIRANDGSLTGSLAVTVTVSDVNEAPTISGDAALSYAENTATTRVLDRYTATDPERSSLTWSVGGTDAGDFNIDASGNLTFAEIPDYEAPADSDDDNVYNIQVVATDDGNLGDGTTSQQGAQSASFDVAVTVTPVNEPPTVTGDTDITLDENTRTFSRTYTASDPEGAASTFTWSVSGTDGGDFNIDRNTGELTFRNTPNFESPADGNRNNEYLVTVRATDEGNLRGDLAVTVTVNDVNEAPTISGDETLTFAENTATTRALDRYTPTDPERSSLTWSVGGTDAGDFNIDASGNLTFAEIPDYEAPADSGGDNVYDIQVVATDDGNLGDGTTSQQGSLSASFDVTINVTPVNEPPTVTGQTSHSVNENVEDFSHTYTASDPEGDSTTFTWSLAGSDGGDFAIDRNKGILTFRSTPNYESPADSNRNNEYLVQVRASDGQFTGSLDVTVTVNDVNEPPAITGDDTPPDFPENSTRSVATYRATDPERATISWTLGGDDSGDFSINDSGVLTFVNIPDFENPADADTDNEYLVTIRAGDGSHTAELDVTVNVINSTGTEEPTITTTSRPHLTYQENGTGTVYTYRARDPQGRPVSWSLLGTDRTDFSISASGALTFNGPPDFENPADANGDNVYEIGVLVTDEQGLTDRLDVTITVTNHHENREPDITTRPSSGLTYHRLTSQENRTTTVYTYSARNYGTGSLIWSVSGTDDGDFGITTDNSGRGLLTFRNTPDFESPADSDGDNDYEITVVVTNTGGYTDRLDVVVTVTDVAEDPTISTRVSSGLTYHNLTYPENRTSTVYTYSASDPQRGPITWSLTGLDADDFTIPSDSSGRGVLTFSSQPDYENPSDSDRDRVYEITVVATDEQGLSDELDVRVTVTEVNEGPEISRTGSAPGSVPENQAQDTVLARYTATDPEGGTVSRWRTSGADGGDFVINEQGELRFRNTPDYERPADSNRDNEYTFTVQVSDGSIYSSFDETVTVTPVNEPPAITTTSSSATALRQTENRTSRLYTYRATDPEGSSTIAWSLGGADSRFFTINERGEFSFREDSAPDFDLPGDSGSDNIYEVTIQVSDDSSPPNTASLPVTVTVTDVNEGPEITSGGDSFTVQENQEWAGATFTARDPENGAVTRWSLGGRDGGDFTIDAGGLMTFRLAPDYERPDDWNRDNIYEVEIRPYDGRYYGSHHVTVTVGDVAEISGNATITRAESQDGVLATYTAGGQGDLAVTPAWRLTGTDGGDFTIDENGQLAFRSTPDHERPADSNRDNEYLFTVQASDDRYYDTLDVTVTVTAVNEPPTITTTSRTEFTQPENRRTRLYTWRATDPEGGSTITWSLAGVDSRFFTINQRGEFSYSPTSPPDYEQPGDSGGDNVYDATIQVTDDDSNTATLEVTVTVTDVNEGPEITSGGSRFTVQENQDLSNATFTASDPENPTEPIARWTLGGRDGGDFTITENGVMTFRNNPDYERPADSDRNNIYEVEVRPYDGRYYGSHAVTVTVTPINEAPEITTTSTSATTMRHPENRTSRLYAYRATDPENRAVTWSVAGTHARFFRIDEQRGELYFDEDNGPDYETPLGSGTGGHEYQVTVQASDNSSPPNTASLEVTVTITDVNEGPEVTSGGESFTVPENQDLSNASFSASDPEGGTVARWSLGGRDGGDFTITETGVMTFRSIPDYERPADSDRNNIYEVEVRPYDGRYYGSHAVTVTVTPVNEAPEITTNNSSATTMRHPENRTSRLYTYRATDPEREAISWSVAGTHARFFSIDEERGELYFSETTPPDYENPQGSGSDSQEYQVTIQASDDDNNVAGLDVSVTITDVNEGPEVTSGGDTFTVQENSDWSGASFGASDPEGETISRWTLGGRDGGDFTITEAGVMTFRRTPDHERPDDSDRDNIYEVEVRPYDGRYYGSHQVTVTVADVSEISGASTITQPENFEGTLATYTAGGTGDLVVDPTWRLTGTDSGDFTIDENGALAFRNIPDYERPADSNRDNVYTFTVQATDDRYYGTLDATVTVTPVNEAPTITTATASAAIMRHPENRTSRLYTYRATDPEGATVRWSVAGVDSRFFTIDEQRGELYFSETSPPDYENPQGSGTDVYEYLVDVRASDEDSNFTGFAVNVTITNVNEGPVISRSGNLQDNVPENQLQDTVLARYSATDPEDTSATITRWSTSGSDGGDFVISELGELRFRNSPDFERPADSNRDNVYEVMIRASDGRYTGTLDETQIVTVTNVNEAPVITTKSRTEFTQRENTASVLYTYRATDPDPDDTIAWTVEGSDGDDFAIYNGVLSFRLLPDYELPADSDGDNVYDITVVAADPGGLRDTVDATITVTEVNEGPKVTGTTAFAVTEGQDLVGASFTANDQEGDEVTRWSLSGSDGGDFQISEFGELTFRTLPDYDRPEDSNRDNEYLVSVRAYDSGNRYGSLDVTVTVNDINEEAPVVTGRETLTFRENTAITTRLYTYRATDTDLNTVFTWSVGGTDGGDFTITRDSSGRGELYFKSPPDHEQPADQDTDNVYDINIVASDGTNAGELSVTVTVTEVNEGPAISGTTQFTVNERQSVTQSVDVAGATFTAADPEGDEVTRWSLTGSDGGDFTIADTSDQTGQDTAQLRFRNPPDVDRPADSNRDNEYLVTIRAYDSRGRYGSFDIMVNVTGANEPPVITGSNARTFLENGTGAIYTYRANDPEGDEFDWIQPGGTDGSLFDMSDRGVLTFKTPPDFDVQGDDNEDNKYELAVRAEDDQGNTGTFDVTVTVTDLNEGPVVSATNDITDAAVQENHDPASVLLTFTAADPEIPDSAISRWSLSGSDGGDFIITDTSDQTGNNTAALTFRNAPDYDRPADSNRDNEYLVSVRAYDATNRYGSLEVTVTVGSENETPPVVTGNQTMSFRENTSITQRLYTYRATDADRNTIITWSVRGRNGSDDGDAFDIDADDGVLTFRSPPDHERPTDSDTDNEYLLEIVATDDQGSEGTLEVTVTITDVNEGPEPTGTTAYTVVEGQSLTGATFTARDPDPGQGEDAVTGWRLAGSDAGDFNIGPTGTYTAQLTFRNTPDFDRPADGNRDNEYLVTIRAYNGSTYGELDVTVTVRDENEAAPEVTGRDTLSFRENTATDVRLYTYTARDMDLNTTIQWSVRGTDGGDFTITPDSSGRGQLFFSSAPNHEQPADADQDNVYEITVVASDGSNEGTLDVTVTVTEVNEGPEVTGQTARTVGENFDQVLTTYTAVDPEGSTVTRWILGGSDAGDFTITDTSEETGRTTADLTFRNPPDFDRPADSNRDNEYLVTIRPYDGRVYGSYEVTITVTSDNEPPVITGDDARDSRENGTGTIYTYRATDPEGDDFTWSVGGLDASRFEISDRGVLTFTNAPDFESPPRPGDNEYQVTVQATDAQGGIGTLEVIVTVTDQDEGPEIAETSTNTAITVQENHDAVLATYTATDPEDPAADITRWSVTGRDGGDFTINEQGELTFRSNPDHERPADSNRDNIYEVTVRASDGRYYGTLDVVVTVNAVNEAPEFRSNSTVEFTYQENATSVLYTYRATDPEGGDITWRLSGADSSAFEISDTGVLTFASPPDYESPTDSGSNNVYQVTVEARDADDSTAQVARLEATVTVTNVTD